jgi:hypothetical protein
MKRVVLLVFGLIAAVLLFLLLSQGVSGRLSAAAPSQPLASPALSDGIVMSGGSAIDIQWTAATYASEGFAKWQIRRDTVPPTSPTTVFESSQTTGVIHRDTVPVPGAKYRYAIWHDECWWVGTYPYTKVCGWRSKAEWDADSSALRGWVTTDLVMAPGTYTGWLIVNPGVQLAMRQGTVIDGGSYFYGGGLELDGVTFAQTQIRFGKLEDGTSGSGGVRGCTFLDQSGIRAYGNSQEIEVSGNGCLGQGCSVSLYGASSGEISDNTGAFSIFLADTASAMAADNTLTSIYLDGANHLIAERNTMSDGVFVWGAGLTAAVRNSTIISDDPTYMGEEGHGIIARAGTWVTAEDNELINTDPSEYGTMKIQAEGDAVLIARRNRVVGAISAIDDVEATITDNVITKVGLAVSATRTKEITGNTIGSRDSQSLTRHVTFYKAVPAAALITNNCFRNLSLWVNVEGPRSAYLSLRGNYWGAASGPKTPANPGGTGVTLNGASYALWDPFDRTGAACRDEPPPPPVDVSELEVTTDPDRLVPNGTATAWISAYARGAGGGPTAGADVVFTAPFLMGHWATVDRCTTGADGRCRVQYVAPTPQEAAFGPDDVVLTGSAGGLADTVRIELLYLSVVQVSPPRDRRNVDLAGLSLEAVFNREVDLTTIDGHTFRVTSIDHYSDGVLCEYRRGFSANSIACDLSLANPATDPRAQAGLALTGRISGGIDGVRTGDGRFMKTDYTWRIFTTPVLEPAIYFDQVTEGPSWAANKDAAVRVAAGLSEESELDWVDADVVLRYPPGAETFSRSEFRFYRTMGVAPLEVRQKGNTANFLSVAGEIPIGRQLGEHAAHVTVTPADQLMTLFIDPHAYTAHATVVVRALKGEYWPFRISTYPMVPTDHPLHEFPYPWTSGQAVPEVARSDAVRQGPFYVERWTPLRDVDQAVGMVAADVWAPFIPNPKNDGAWYLARLVRHADWTVPTALDSGGIAVLLAPWDWMWEVNGGLPTWHGPAHHVCLTSVDAPARFNPALTLAWCVGHLSGVPDTVGAPGYVMQGYDVIRDRYVDATVPETGYHVRVMAFEQFPGADLRSFWMDQAGYETLVDRFVAGGGAASAPGENLRGRAPAAAWRDLGGIAGPAAATPDAATLTIGGEIARQAGLAETGLLDVLELPARSAYPAPSGAGEYRLRLLGSGAALLVEHAFTPQFTALRAGLDYASLLFNVPAPAGLHSVQLLRGTTLLAEAEANSTAPLVTIQAPTAGSYSGAITVRWTGTDPDSGASLAYTVLYSTDNGASWQAVSLSTTSQQLTVDTAQYANCTQCRIKIIVHDGFHSTTAVSAAFSVANAPMVTSTWPPDDATGVPPWPPVTATFRDPMNAGTITASSFTLVDAGGRPVAAVVTHNTDTRRATLAPAAALVRGATYTARLAGTISDTGGRPLGADVVWRLTIEPSPVAGIYLPLVRR